MMVLYYLSSRCCFVAHILIGAVLVATTTLQAQTTPRPSASSSLSPSPLSSPGKMSASPFPSGTSLPSMAPPPVGPKVQPSSSPSVGGGGSSSSLPTLLQPTPFPTPSNTSASNSPISGGTGKPAPVAGEVSSHKSVPFLPPPDPSLGLPTPFPGGHMPSIPLHTPSPGAFSSGTDIFGGGGNSNFPSSLLPPVPEHSAPTVHRTRIAKTPELGIHAPKLTLDDAVQYALKHNAEILNAVQQIRISRGQFISIRAQLLPQLVGSGTFSGQSPILVNPPTPGGRSGSNLGESLIPVTSEGETSELKSDVPINTINNLNWNVQIAVQQLIFDGGGALAATQAAKYIEDNSYFMLRNVIDNVIAKVKSAFFQIILNRALIVVQEQSVALLENQLEDQESRYQAGTVPKFNVLQAQVAVANAIPPLITARNNLRISQYQLVQLIGMNYTSDPTQIPFHVVGKLNIDFRKIDPEESIRIGLTRNPSLKAQRVNILAQAASVTSALSGYYPRITASAGYLVTSNYTYQRLGQAVEGWFFGFNGTWNIFDGLNTYGKVLQAKAQLEQAKINYDNSVRNVILNIQRDISNLQQAQETIESQQASVVQATEALRLARERLDAGVGTQLDVLNAQVALLQAQTTVLQAQFTYIQALAQYDAALSLNTRYVEWFRDPLENKEKWRFARLNGAGYVMSPLPRVYRNKDPVVPILGPTPAPTPRLPLVNLLNKKPPKPPTSVSQ